MSSAWVSLVEQLQGMTAELAATAGQGEHHRPAPAVFAKADVATRLLLNRCEQEGFTGFGQWLNAFARYLYLLQSNPGRNWYSVSALEELVAYMERLLGILDGEASLYGSVQLPEVRHLQSALLPRPTKPLDTARVGPEPPVVLIVVASSLRATALQEKIAAAGFSGVVCRTAADAIIWVHQGPVLGAVICDEIEPSRNLSQLNTSLQTNPPMQQPPLILTTASQRPQALRKAHALGAVGVWRAPYTAQEFLMLVDGNQP